LLFRDESAFATEVFGDVHMHGQCSGRHHRKCSPGWQEMGRPQRPIQSDGVRRHLVAGEQQGQRLLAHLVVRHRVTNESDFDAFRGRDDLKNSAGGGGGEGRAESQAESLIAQPAAESHGSPTRGRNPNANAFRTKSVPDPLRSRDDFRLLMMDVAFPAEPLPATR
jgi:hypothetical protein